MGKISYNKRAQVKGNDFLNQTEQPRANQELKTSSKVLITKLLASKIHSKNPKQEITNWKS